jgi:hypothetical protein
MEELLDKAIEMNIDEYSSLEKPTFVGQTSVDNHRYWVVVESHGILYKFHMWL